MAEMDSPSGRQLPGGAVNSWNEWDPLEGVIVGSARGAVEMADEPSLAPYCLPGQPAGGSARIPQVVVDDAERQLDAFADLLARPGITVHRPEPADHALPVRTPDWEAPFGGGFHCCTLDTRRAGTLQSYFPTLD